MNREIMFRYWDATRGNECMCYMDEEYKFRYPSSNFPLTFAHAMREINSGNTYYSGNRLMQYTGLEDKNGKPIYEGDILRDPNDHETVGSIDYEPLYAGFKWLMPEEMGKDEYAKLEVIGNIYENPDLLPKDKGEEHV